ncbi:MAG: triose-phosphate isomerase [Halanaerobiaceae bacterium]
MRIPFIAGNWKMNKTQKEAVELVEWLKERVEGINDVEIGVCPPAVDLPAVQEVIADSNIRLGAQNMHPAESGAYTGEIAPPMLVEIGVEYVIIGHSERREYYGETDLDVSRKVKAAFKHGLKPIVCVGETLEERKRGETLDKVTLQVKALLTGLTEEQAEQIVIAYEPIWAIGTGESASAEEAQEVISSIRKVIAEDYPVAAEKIRIQYGGSVKPHNIENFIKEKDIDGALVGGASLEAESFSQIVKKSR